MAPFKLKFRMGSSSRSTSQEIEEPVQQPLLTRQSSICDSNTTIDSEFTSMSSTNDQHNLLPNKFDEETGYENPAIMRTITDSRCYQNIHTSNAPSHSTATDNLQEHEQCSHQYDGDVPTNIDGVASVGTQIFLSNSGQSNENLMDSTVGSSDPLFVCQNAEDGILDVRTAEIETKISSNNEPEQDCSSNSSDGNTVNVAAWHLSNSSDRNALDVVAWQTNENSSQDVHSIVDTIISNKSSKKIYKAVAKEWGITCKMSETCRCMDCQSNYFDCEFDENEHQKTDGGLGAGTPMFINEVMHGSACTII